nr:hypothetical protein [Enterobacter hormaechei]
MSSNLARNPFIKILYEYRHVAFLVLIYAAEMTVWAVLNLKGLGDEDFSTWRIFLLVSVGVIAGSAGILDDPDDGWRCMQEPSRPGSSRLLSSSYMVSFK